jgi:hypothetical protein
VGAATLVIQVPELEAVLRFPQSQAAASFFSSSSSPTPSSNSNTSRRRPWQINQVTFFSFVLCSLCELLPVS